MKEREKRTEVRKDENKRGERERERERVRGRESRKKNKETEQKNRIDHDISIDHLSHRRFSSFIVRICFEEIYTL